MVFLLYKNIAVTKICSTILNPEPFKLVVHKSIFLLLVFASGLQDPKMGTRSQLPSSVKISRPPLTLPGHGYFNQAMYKPF